MTPKERQSDLVKKLRDAAKMQEPAARSVIELVKLTSDELKERLVDASGDDMFRLQGAVRQFDKLHRELTTIPPTIAAQSQE